MARTTPKPVKAAKRANKKAAAPRVRGGSTITTPQGNVIAETRHVDATPKAGRVTYATSPRAWLESVAEKTGLGMTVDMVDETAGVLVLTGGQLTYSFVPTAGGGKIDVEVSSKVDGEARDSAPLPGATTRSTPEKVAAAIVAFHLPQQKPTPNARKRTAPEQTGGKTANITQADYDRQVKAIDASELGSRFKAAAKAVLTKKAREGGLDVAGSRKPTAAMSIEQIRERRSDAARRAVATRRENEARAIAAAKKATAPRRAPRVPRSA